MSFDAMRYAEYSAAQQRRSGVGRKAPLGVLVVACFQFVKGCVLLSTAAMLWMHPERLAGAYGALSPLLYLALRGRSFAVEAARQGGNQSTVLLAVLGLYVVAIGFGLIGMRPWARRSVLVTTAMTLVLYGRSILFPEAFAAAQPSLHDVHLLLAIDAVIFVFLARGSMGERFTSAR